MPDCTSVPTVDQAAPARKNPIRPPGELGDQARRQRRVDEQLQRAEGQRRVHLADRRGHRRHQRDHHDRHPARRSRTGRSSRPSMPNAVPETVRRSWSRSGAGWGAWVATSAPIVPNTPALRTGPARCPRPRRRRAPRARGCRWRSERRRATAPAGGRVRTSSSSQAGAWSALRPAPALRHPGSLSPGPGPGRFRSSGLQSGPVPVPLRDVIAALDARYDPALAESWDAVGLVRGSGRARAPGAVRRRSDVRGRGRGARDRRRPARHPPPAPAHRGARRARRRPKGRLVHRLVRAGPRCSSRTPTPTGHPGSASTTPSPVPSRSVDAVPLEPTAADPRAGLGRDRPAGGGR